MINEMTRIALRMDGGICELPLLPSLEDSAPIGPHRHRHTINPIVPPPLPPDLESSSGYLPTNPTNTTNLQTHLVFLKWILRFNQTRPPGAWLESSRVKRKMGKTMARRISLIRGAGKGVKGAWVYGDGGGGVREGSDNLDPSIAERPTLAPRNSHAGRPSTSAPRAIPPDHGAWMDIYGFT